MKYFLPLICLLFSSSTAIAQIIRIPEAPGCIGLPMYNEQDMRLSQSEINDLSEYGLDVQKYNKLNRIAYYCDGTAGLASIVFIYACIDQGKLIQRGNLEYYEKNVKIGGPAFAVICVALGIKEYCRHRINKDLKIVNEKLSVQPAESGLGLALVL